MSKIKSFDRPALKALRVSLDSALAKVAAEHGIGKLKRHVPLPLRLKRRDIDDDAAAGIG